MGLNRGRLRQSGWAAWAGLAAGVAGWGLHQQVLGDMLHFDCTLGGAAPTLLGGALATVLIGAGAWVSWLARPGRAEQHERAGAQRFVADLSLLGAALFLLPVLAGTLAGLMVPACPP
jgi:hypothetical protein